MHVNETCRQITLDTFRFMDTLSLEGVFLAETWDRLLLPKRVITGKETKRGVLKTTLQTIYLFISIKLNFPGLVQSVQVLSCVWLFVIPWTVARQISLSVTNSQSFLKLMSKKSVMPSNHLILCHPLLLPPTFFFQYQSLFKWVISSNQVANLLEFQLQHQSFQWIFRTDFL